MHRSIALCLLLLGGLIGPLFASSYGGGGSYNRPKAAKPKVDKTYELGSRIYTGKQRVANRTWTETAFERQVVGMDQAQRQVNDRNAPAFFRLAGRLTDEEYTALRHFLNRRFRVTLPASRPNPDYAATALWLRSPKAQVEHDTALAERQLPNLHRISDAAVERGISTGRFGHLAGSIEPDFFKNLQSYAQTNLGVRALRPKPDDLAAYSRGNRMLTTKGADALMDTVDVSLKRKQVTFLTRLNQKLSSLGISTTVLHWAGRLSEDDFNALRQHAWMRYSVR
jgi:hypothetical protein